MHAYVHREALVRCGANPLPRGAWFDAAFEHFDADYDGVLFLLQLCLSILVSYYYYVLLLFTMFTFVAFRAPGLPGVSGLPVAARRGAAPCGATARRVAVPARRVATPARRVALPVERGAVPARWLHTPGCEGEHAKTIN